MIVVLRLCFPLQETLFGTIVVGIIWALVAFVALLMQFGPNEPHQGDLRYLYTKYIKKLDDEQNPYFSSAKSESKKLDAIEIR